ncbi:aldehyde dehydrogenase family protein [Verminephrobacter eiseniae]|uniref:aldehyde dehydrogenase family protein n=1 Tax=Verminephrobacter eiseniae TaxID=364317 RepID=UPI0022380CE9|nr:aldehyde dehydrogenase family protein [Verminephrobacter eiseniae]
MATRQAASELISIDPANGAEIARVRITSAQELDAVVARAWHAFRHSGWKSLLPHQRALVLHAIADGLAAEKQALARLRCCSTPASR